MGEQEYLSLAGTVTAIIYQNEENGYTVLRLLEDGGEETTVVGCIPGAVPGEQLEVFGEWAKHPQHGAQFKASWSQRSLPETEDGIYSYLSSGAIKGIGPATATMLLTQFGARTLDVIENEPERLTALRGFSRKKAMQISENFRKQVGMRRLMEYLAAQELRPILALRLYRAYGENAYALVRENPYVLTGEKVGAGFDEADRLALAGGFAPDSPARIGAAIVHELSFNANQGHVFIPRDKLIAVTAKLLDIDAENERILKEYVDGRTVFELVREGAPIEDLTAQVRAMAALAEKAGLNIDYFPTNFVICNDVIWYVDYECNPYMEQWDFEHWGIRYWSRTPEFNAYLEQYAASDAETD